MASETLNRFGLERLEQLCSRWSSVPHESGIQEELTTLLALSDFIFDQCHRHEVVYGHLVKLLATDFQACLARPSEDLQALTEMDEKSIMSHLRICRQLHMVDIAARDFLARQDIQTTMRQLSELADEFYFVSRHWCQKQMAPRWGESLTEDGRLVPLIALGMGKLGGYELNFSSDIDLIFCYPEKGETRGGRRREDFHIYFTKLAQKIIQLLDAVTAEGRVYRVDMRLRPFGDSGPLVNSFEALEDYYQEQGREWERYALLKARPLGVQQLLVEEEIEQQEKLKTLLRPFVFRRYIDFSVIDSLRGMKRLIQSEVTRRQLKLNIKLGEGGIREVEFIVQAMQILRGGKEPLLQQSSLLKVLPELVKLKVFSDTECEQIRQDYLWLRQCEQYLQAFDDQQTQTLPDSELGQRRLLHLFNTPDWSSLLAQLQSISLRVHKVFMDVIGEGEAQPGQTMAPDLQIWQRLWLTDTPETETLDPMQAMLCTMKSELRGALSGSRGREKLDQLLPLLMWHCQQQGLSSQQAKEILLLIKKIASRTTYLELLVENTGALKQLVKLCASCRFIGTQLSRFPLLLDQLIDPKLLYRIPDIESYEAELRRTLLRIEPDDLEQQMEALRQFKLTSQLVIAACDVEQLASVMQVSDHLTAIAEACLTHGINLAWHQMVSRFGYPEGASDENKRFGVIGYGKLGGFELGYGSDLDIVFVHECDSMAPTTGPKPIDSRQFYLKLAQRIMHLFTTRTLSGELYEIDTRLRPSGLSGLLAIHIETFEDYQETEAWTWEHQALVRSRLVAGDTTLAARFDEIKGKILARRRDSQSLRDDIVQMRQKMHDNLSKEREEQFDLKQSRGGIADIEFIGQYLVLAHSHRYPELVTFPDNVRIFEQALKLGLLSHGDAESLINTYLLYRAYYHKASLNHDEKLVPVQQVAASRNKVLELWQRYLSEN